MTEVSNAVRIGDAERDAAIGELGEHFAAGRLSREEFDERSATALGARRRGELDVLFEDLPAPAPEPAATGRRRPGPARLWLPAVLGLALVVTLALTVGSAVVVHAPWVLWVLLALFLFGRGRHRHAYARHGHPWDPRWADRPEHRHISQARRALR